MSWITDEHGLGRQSQYVDLAAKPPQLGRGRFFGYAAEIHRFQGQLCLVLTAKDREFLDCGNSVTFGVIDQVSALLSVGVEIGVARSWSRERTFPSQPCASCVPVLRLTDATLTVTALYRRRRGPRTASRRTLVLGPDCERHYETDCVPRLECPGCGDGETIQPGDLRERLGSEDGGEHTAVTLSVESVELESRETEALLEESAEWLEDALDFPEVDAAQGVFVQEHGRGLAFLPTEIDSAPSDLYPASLLSIGRDIAQIGGIVVEPGETFPVVLLASRSDSVRGWAGFIDREDSDPADVWDERVALEDIEVGPFSLLAAALPREEASDDAPKDLVVRVFDEPRGRSRTLRFPLRDTMGELVVSASS